MPHTYNPSIGPAKGQPITVSDEIHTIIQDTTFHDGQDMQKSIEQTVANNSYNGQTIELFQNNPISNEVTHAIINSSWGTKFISQFNPTLKEYITNKAIENPDVVQDILEELLQEDIENTIELTQFLIDHAQDHPDEIQTIIELATSFF